MQTRTDPLVGYIYRITNEVHAKLTNIPLHSSKLSAMHFVGRLTVKEKSNLALCLLTMSTISFWWVTLLLFMLEILGSGLA